MNIGDICNIRIGHTFRGRIMPVADGEVRVITPADITSDGSIGVSDRGELLTDLDSYRPVEDGELLVINRGRFAAAVFNDTRERPCVVHSTILVLTVTGQRVLTAYLAAWFNSSSGQRQLQRQCEHTSMPYISTSNLKSMEVPVPSLERQQALVNFQETVRKTGNLYQRKHQLYQQLLDRELAAATSEPEKKP